MSDTKNHYRGILKATSLIGGSSFINILIGMVRTKFVAMLLGPAGVGLMGMYGTITGMIGTISGMGLGSSGVRQIAESHSSGDEERIARTVKTLRRTVWFTGSLGMLATVLGCVWWSKLSFGSTQYALAIALLGVTILLSAISGGQSCILQGTRRISDLAKINIIGAITGTLISIPCFYLWGMNGIVPSLLFCAIAGLITSWWFAQRILIKDIDLPWNESREEAVRLLTFGFPIMLSGFVSMLTAYLVRLILVRQVGLEGVGIFQAAFAISSILVNFVLAAMGTDYYPRLTAMASDNTRVSHEVNAQTEIALLLAVPALAATIVFAPLAIAVFYSGKFDDAVPILRWSVYGILGRVISWPLGFVILAKGRSKIFLCTETVANIFHLMMIWLCTSTWGLAGTGIAFMLLYIWVTIMVYAVVFHISKTHWTWSCICHIAIFIGMLAFMGINCALNPIFWMQWSISFLLLGLISAYCLKKLMEKSGVTVKSILIKLRNR
jgi:PST family polysaccharide transporter